MIWSEFFYDNTGLGPRVEFLLKFKIWKDKYINHINLSVYVKFYDELTKEKIL